MAAKRTEKRANGGANLGFEATLWAAADKLRGHMDAAEYKHVVLGLIFLKYISDAFEEIHTKLAAEKGADPEDRDEYVALNIFWVPPEARWTYLQGRAKDPLIGKLLDNAMVAIERDNPSLKGVLPKNYARPDLNKQQLGEVIDLIATIGLGDKESRSKDILGRVYEYFLSQFASAEGKKGGQFYTPRCVVQLLVEMLAPYKGRVFDPCCGSGGMFVQSVRFVKEHATGNGNGGKARGDISIFGQESNPTTWKLAKMNLAIRGIEADLGDENADSFHRDLHKDLKADYILANPPFNMSDWGGDRLREDSRWKYGAPPVGNANFAWVQHILHHLAPSGYAGIVLANSSVSSNQSGEGEIRRGIIEADLVDCVVALPDKLFYTVPHKVCLWIFARSKKGNGRRDRSGQILFIDARKPGGMIDRTHRELNLQEITQVASIYHAWRGDHAAGQYSDVPGFCSGLTARQVREKGFVLLPSRYVASGEDSEDEDEPFTERLTRVSVSFRKQLGDLSELGRTALNLMQDCTLVTSVDSSSRHPDGWAMRRLADVCEINPSRPRSMQRDEDAPTTFVPMAAVDAEIGAITRPEIRPFHSVRKGYTYFAEGDLIFAKITPCMENGKHAIARNLIGGIAFGSTEFHVIRCGKELLAEWLHRYLRQPDVLQEATTYFTGTAGQQRVPVGFLENLILPLPPLSEQKALVKVMETFDRTSALLMCAAKTVGTAESVLLPKLLSGEVRVKTDRITTKQ
jgi:type I restriction enzyme M protein